MHYNLLCCAQFFFLQSTLYIYTKYSVYFWQVHFLSKNIQSRVLCIIGDFSGKVRNLWVQFARKCLTVHINIGKCSGFVMECHSNGIRSVLPTTRMHPRRPSIVLHCVHKENGITYYTKYSRENIQSTFRKYTKYFVYYFGTPQTKKNYGPDCHILREIFATEHCWSIF